MWRPLGSCPVCPVLSPALYGRIRGMVAREGFVYEQNPLSVTRNVVVREGWSLVRVVVRQGFYCMFKNKIDKYLVKAGYT